MPSSIIGNWRSFSKVGYETGINTPRASLQEARSEWSRATAQRSLPDFPFGWTPTCSNPHDNSKSENYENFSRRCRPY